MDIHYYNNFTKRKRKKKIKIKIKTKQNHNKMPDLNIRAIYWEKQVGHCVLYM